MSAGSLIGREQTSNAGANGPATLRERKVGVLAELARSFARAPVRRLLVVGCGPGVEAAILARELRTEVVGIDLRVEFDPAAALDADLRRGDATCLEFADGAFDFVYSYHVLEHIPDHRRALSEMRRVLAEGGNYLIGTPNRLRLVGLGGAGASWREKLATNAADWKARMRGRFRNEFGAHAGFTPGELRAALLRVFGTAEDVSLRYYAGVYRRHAVAVGLLAKTGLDRFAFPGVYFMGGR